MTILSNDSSLDGFGLIKTTDTASIGTVFSSLPQRRLTDEHMYEWRGVDPSDDVFMVAHRMDCSAPPHGHEFYEFSFVLDGTVINAVDGQRLYMLPETLCIMNLDSVHSLEAVDPEAAVINLCARRRLFDEGVFRSFLESDSVMARFLRGETGKSHLFFSGSGNHALANIMMGIAQEYARAGNRQSYSLLGRLLILLDELARTPAYSFYGMDSNAVRMISYIRDHCDTASVKEIAREFGYSENYCTQYIKKHVGRSASELIAEARIARAEKLLQSSDLSVQAIANAVGYKSVGHFNELFRSYHGMTPGDYRKLSRFTL